MAPPAKLERAYRAILFDLFGTLVFFRSPSMTSGHRPAALQAAVERELPRIAVGDFFDAVKQVSKEIAVARRDTHEECPSEERFRLALLRLGIADADLAARLTSAHMAGLAASTEMPRHHLEVLAALRRQYRIGLVSNFDHGPTARQILRQHGLDELLEHVVISAEFGWRKPSPGIFLAATEALGVSGSEAIHVGDTPFDDIEGAGRAGIDSIWIGEAEGSYPGSLHPPTATIASLAELPARFR